jgi:hypothetical protein
LCMHAGDHNHCACELDKRLPRNEYGVVVIWNMASALSHARNGIFAVYLGVVSIASSEYSPIRHWLCHVMPVTFI